MRYCKIKFRVLKSITFFNVPGSTIDFKMKFKKSNIYPLHLRIEVYMHQLSFCLFLLSNTFSFIYPLPHNAIASIKQRIRVDQLNATWLINERLCLLCSFRNNILSMHDIFSFHSFTILAVFSLQRLSPCNIYLEK